MSLGSIPQVFVDKVGSTSGSALNQALLDALVPASPYLQNLGSLPSFPTANLSFTFPTTSAVIGLSSGGVQYAQAPATNHTAGASKDIYVDITSANTLTFSEVNNGAGQPAQAANTFRVGKLVSNATQVTGWTQLGVGNPTNQYTEQADPTEAATMDVLGPNSATVNNLNRMRSAIATALGAAWNSGRAILDSSSRLLGNGAILNTQSSGYIKLISNSGGNSYFQSANGATFIANNAVFTGSGWVYDTNGPASLLYVDATSTWHLNQAPSGTAGSAITWSTPLQINPNGITSLIPQQGLRQQILSANSTNSPNLNATVYSNVPWTFSPAPNITTYGGAIRVRLYASNLGTGAPPLSMDFQVLINGTAYYMGNTYLATSAGAYDHSFVCKTANLTAGTYSVTLQYKNSAAVNVGANIGSFAMEIEEVG